MFVKGQACLFPCEGEGHLFRNEWISHTFLRTYFVYIHLYIQTLALSKSLCPEARAEMAPVHTSNISVDVHVF